MNSYNVEDISTGHEGIEWFNYGAPEERPEIAALGIQIAYVDLAMDYLDTIERLYPNRSV